MLAIKNNMMAANAARYLGKSYDALATSVERLSSGLRINSAKDDAAGMAVRELMRADVAVIEQGVRNTQDGISMLQTMEGAMATIDNALVRMKQLAEQASTGSYSSAQRVIMNTEFAEMAAEVERISKSTRFNGIAMLNKTDPDTLDPAADVTIRFGTGTTDEISVARTDMTQNGLGITTGSAGFEAVSGVGTGTDLPTTDTWLTVTGAARKIVITFSDGVVNEDAITISVSATGSADGDATYSMQEIADLINSESQNLGNDAEGVSKNYQMAEVIQGNDTTNGRLSTQYYLKLKSRLSGADGLSMLTDAVGGTALAGGWIADATGIELTEAYSATNNDGRMGERAGTGINLLTADAAQDAMTAVATAIGLKDTARAAFGYKMNRLESTGEVLAIQAENLQTAESRISDVDVATEMATLTRNQVLAQAGTAMLAQANSIPQMALTLLR
jgi:flagellin